MKNVEKGIFMADTNHIWNRDNDQSFLKVYGTERLGPCHQPAFPIFLAGVSDGLQIMLTIGLYFCGLIYNGLIW